MSAPEAKTFGGPPFREDEIARWVSDTVTYARAWGLADRLAAALAEKPPTPPAEHEQGHR